MPTRTLRSRLPTDGRVLRAAKVAADLALWSRIGVQRATERTLRPAARRPLPASAPVTGVLHDHAEVAAAVREARALRLPLHPTRAKNWDVLGAVRAVLEDGGPGSRVVDAGAARYSTVLPALRLYGLRRLTGTNPEFRRATRRGPVRFEPGDATRTGLRDGSLDAITCLSVIEHGVDVPAFLAESARVLRPGGRLVVSTDYDAVPPDTTGLRAYGRPVRVFGPDGVRAIVAAAAATGLRLVGDLDLAHAERPVRWDRLRLDYTFVLLTFEKGGATGTAGWRHEHSPRDR